MDSNFSLALVAILLLSVAVWWIAAPFLVSASDRRLVERNPDHHAKLVRFYRHWGFAAIAIGVVVAIVI